MTAAAAAAVALRDAGPARRAEIDTDLWFGAGAYLRPSWMLPQYG